MDERRTRLWGIGHEVGDYALKALSRFLFTCISKTDVLGRYGGEEFTIILPETRKEDAFTLLDKIRHKVDKEAFEYENVKHHIQISMGLAEFHQDDAVTLSNLFKKADDALYQSKQRGRNMVTAYKHDFPLAPKKEDKNAKNADRQELSGKKKVSTNRASPTKRRVPSKAVGSGSSRELRDILREKALEPSRNASIDQPRSGGVGRNWMKG